MSLALYMDHHIPSAVTTGLRNRGLDVLTAYEDGFSEADDERLLARATELGRVFCTHDDEWLQAGRSFAGAVYSHQSGVAVGKAIADLELIAKASEPEDMRNQVEFLPL